MEFLDILLLADFKENYTLLWFTLQKILETRKFEYIYDKHFV
jgi:hypothetical protein